MESLLKVKEILKENYIENYKYQVPSVWLENKNSSHIIEVNPFEYYIDTIDTIINSNQKPFKEFREVKTQIYNFMPRLSTSFEHNQKAEKIYFKDSGTLLKSIALLPYIKTLGTDIVYLLPITSIGKDEAKGNLGSIYAVKNPYKIDENLSENLPGLDEELLFKAFVEASHKLGMKVVTEFIFRTASIDSDWALQHPEWFYWLKSDINNRIDKEDKSSYGPPIFDFEVLSNIKQAVENKDYENYFAPDIDYKNMFTETPIKVNKENGKIIGKLKNGEKCRIPGAFADWPPDDNQPVWSDVTYLKLFSSDDYNYIAYNTVRMYDEEIQKPENINQPLWNEIINIIPHWIEKYNIDGIMLDMGHALPEDLRKQIIKTARNLNPDFLLFEENFSLNQSSKDEGYNASLGYLPFDLWNAESMKRFIQRVENKDVPLYCFATCETHNTKRTFHYKQDKQFQKLVWGVSAFLPKTLPFIHSGFELLEDVPVNTGLCFTDEEIRNYTLEDLALFSAKSLKWNGIHIIEDIKKINFIKNYLLSNEIISDSKLSNLNNYNILAYVINTESGKEILVAANYSHNEESAELFLTNLNKSFYNSITCSNFEVCDGVLKLDFTPFEFMVGILK